MRVVLLASLCVVALGCGGRNGPEPGGAGGSGGSAGGVGGNGGSGGSGGGGGSTGTKGATCKTACDCEPGLGCSSGTCGTGTAAAYYCCDDVNACPNGSACETPTGSVSTCGAGGSGGSGGGGSGGSGGGGGSGGFGGGGGGGGIPFPIPDGGAGGYCALLPCTTDQGCQTFGCGSCDTSTKKCK